VALDIHINYFESSGVHQHVQRNQDLYTIKHLEEQWLFFDCGAACSAAL